MTKTAEQEVVVELAREVVARAAPEELSLFRVTAEAYLRDPNGVLKSSSNSDDMLGFGSAELVAFLTPIVLEVAKSVYAFLAAQVARAAREVGSEAVAAELRSLLYGGHPGTCQLTGAQLAKVREVALEKALQLRLQEDQAELLASSVVGALALP